MKAAYSRIPWKARAHGSEIAARLRAQLALRPQMLQPRRCEGRAAANGIEGSLCHHVCTLKRACRLIGIIAGRKSKQQPRRSVRTDMHVVLAQRLSNSEREHPSAGRTLVGRCTRKTRHNRTIGSVCWPTCQADEVAPGTYMLRTFCSKALDNWGMMSSLTGLL